MIRDAAWCVLFVLLALMVVLSGCAAPVAKPDRPERAHFMFRCMDGELWGAVVPEGWEEGYATKVGRCIGNLQIIGTGGPQTPAKWS